MDVMTMMRGESGIAKERKKERKEENAKTRPKRCNKSDVYKYDMITAFTCDTGIHRAVIGFALPRMDVFAVDVLNPSSRMTASKSAF